ncbi:hypothetical protein TSUD_22350 [Trifolium subterraneum]|uniref:Uncharacterized protein n=1 Tax=Trifolium subterraneum TaxID=3900 RepID=A0A2Z6NJE0_TRISU|nr:hypothetical protein TSUD_22350 [Trifolium subterraneum]
MNRHVRGMMMSCSTMVDEVLVIDGSSPTIIIKELAIGSAVVRMPKHCCTHVFHHSDVAKC